MNTDPTLPLANGHIAPCETFEPLLPLYASGALSPQEAATTQRHVGACARCQAALADYDALRVDLRRQYAVAPARQPDMSGTTPRAAHQAITIADIIRRANQAAPDAVATPAHASYSTALAPQSPSAYIRTLPQPSSDSAPIVAHPLPLAATTRSLTDARHERAPVPSGRRARRKAPRWAVALNTLVAVLIVSLLVSLFIAARGLPFFSQGAGSALQLITRFPLPTGSFQPGQIIAGQGGDLWFIESDGPGRSGLARITADGQITLHRFPGSGTDLTALAMSSNGMIWARDSYSVWEYDPATGGMRQFPVNVKAGAIAVAPDGSVWFTDGGAGAIGRLDPPTGKITRYPITQLDALRLDTLQTRAIVAAPDGDIWVTVYGHNAITTAHPGPYFNWIARLAPATGAIKLIPLPLDDPSFATPLPYQLAVGPQGNIWFTFNEAICAVSPQGVVRHIASVPGSMANKGIVVTANGDLWLISIRGYLLHVTPQGKSTMYYWLFDEPGITRPYAFTAGADHTLWVTTSISSVVHHVASTHNYVVRIALPPGV